MSSVPHDIPIALRDCVIEDIRIGEQIGTGANGRILEARWEGVTVAVKEIYPIFMYVSEAEFLSFKRSFMRECEQRSRLRHPNIVRFFGIYYPSNTRLPSLVMERLHCSLTKLLEENSEITMGRKLSIISDVARGLKYLHERDPPIIHRDLSSNNVLISKRMEGKIGDLGTARLIDTSNQSQMTKAPGTVVFMPPEALEDSLVINYDKELDVFSFGCVMLHTLSHQWPTPLPAVITDPDTGVVRGGRSEVERRSHYFDMIDKNVAGVLTPLIKSCLNNLPKKRTSIMRVCDQLEDLVDEECVPIDDLTVSALQEEIQKKEYELQRRNIEIQELQMNIIEIQTEMQARNAEMLRKDAEMQIKDTEIQGQVAEIQRKSAEIQGKDVEIQMKDTEIQGQVAEIQRKSAEIQGKDVEIQMKDAEIEALRLQLGVPGLPSKQVNKSSRDFWNNLEVTWQPGANLPVKYWATSVAELDGKVYVSGQDEGGGFAYPFMYDSNKDQWSTLPYLPYVHFSLVTITEKKQLLAIGGVIDNNGILEYSNKVFLWDEKYKNWLTLYPNMPTGRCRSSSISHGLAVIVAGGIICHDPFTMTRSVEVLHINDNNLHDSYWSVVEQLPHVVFGAIPLIVNDKLYIAQGYDSDPGSSTCNVVTASLPELLQSSNNNTSSSQVWSKLLDTPYSSFSINHYQGHLITFTGDHDVEQPDEDEPVGEVVPLIHIYNPDTKTWDCVADISIGYLLGVSVHVRENKILFIGGLTGTCIICKNDDIMTTCSILTLTPQ